MAEPPSGTLSAVFESIRPIVSSSSSVTVRLATMLLKLESELVAVWVRTVEPSRVSRSCAAVTVTVCFVLQLEEVKVSVMGLAVRLGSSPVWPRLAMAMETLPVGADASCTV